MFWRVAKTLACMEKPEEREEWEEKFFQLMRSLAFLPNSPTLMNAGRELGMLSACFVLPVGDSIEGIFQAVKETALIHKSGGGTGFFFGDLRPEGSIVGSTGGVASGPCSFIRAFDAATDVVKQGGTRRGANMGILQVDHPDILRFIRLKENGGLENFNISVSVTNRFMERVKEGLEYNLVDPRTGQVVGELNAQQVWDEICQLAWKTGDPGVVFMDRINEDHWNPHLGPIQSTNPCGEQPLMSYESCNLGSINLASIQQLDELDEVIEVAVRFLDNVIDCNRYPLEEIRQRTLATRRIGVGVMGWADYLIDRNIPYDSTKALMEAQRVGQYIRERVHLESRKLAEERGPYPECRLDFPIRNTSPVTIAPTGTISMIAGVSSGVEPIFACGYVKEVMDHTRLLYVNDRLKSILWAENLWSEEVEETIARTGSVQSLEHLPQIIRDIFKAAHEISWESHVRMQAAWQVNTDNAVSKTINMPNSATVEDISQAYFLAHELGCKGITVYRDGSKDQQVLTVGTTNGHIPAQRPTRIDGYTERVRTGHGNIYITLNHLEKKLFEVFAAQGKAGGCDSAQMEAVTRLVTLCLRSDIPIEAVIDQLEGITCCSAWDNGDLVRSGPDAVALALKRFAHSHTTPDHNKVLPQVEVVDHLLPVGKCPDCNGRVVNEEGCRRCLDCGWNRCE